jgi:hypothetical protein
VDNNKIDFRGIRGIRDQKKALMKTEMNLRISKNVCKFLSSYATTGHSRTAKIEGVS